jgi:hypothetical protein
LILTDRRVAALKPRKARYALPDPQATGLYVRVMPSGRKSFVAVTRDPSGRQIWTTLSPSNQLSIDDARDLARLVILEIRAGIPRKTALRSARLKLIAAFKP